MDTTYLTARAAGELTRSTQVVLPMNHALTLPGRGGGGWCHGFSATAQNAL